VKLPDTLLDELRRTAPVHTVLLYGSFARGDATPESDLDVAGFADVPATRHDGRRLGSLFLDAFVYPTERAIAPPDDELRKLRGARVLLDERGLAGPLLAALDALEASPPRPLDEGARRTLGAWAHKMLARIARDDVEAHYRRHWLLMQVLEDHFALEGRWYPGPKLALAGLAEQQPALHAAFAAALYPAADLPAIAALVERVHGPPDEPER
jgi:hypothetical protein